MPELPEVETIKNELLPQLVGRCFTEVKLFDDKILRRPLPEEFCHRLIGQTIEDIRRRGKYLIFHLSDHEKLILHLKMTGFLLWQQATTRPDLYARAIFCFDNGKGLYFYDQRKFAAIWLVNDEAEVVGKLGPESLDHDFTTEALSQILSRHNVPIKALLCDQNLIAGIGNMYADEILFAARIHPLRKARELSQQEVERLHQAICQVLTAAIGHGGASVDTYRHPDGGLGDAHFFFQVAHRGSEPCYHCNTPIKRIPLRGRGTYFCTKCQRI